MIEEINMTGTEFIIFIIVAIALIGLMFWLEPETKLPQAKPKQPAYLERYGAYIQAQGKYYN